MSEAYLTDYTSTTSQCRRILGLSLRKPHFCLFRNSCSKCWQTFAIVPLRPHTPGDLEVFSKPTRHLSDVNSIRFTRVARSLKASRYFLTWQANCRITKLGCRRISQCCSGAANWPDWPLREADEGSTTEDPNGRRKLFLENGRSPAKRRITFEVSQCPLISVSRP